MIAKEYIFHISREEREREREHKSFAQVILYK